MLLCGAGLSMPAPSSLPSAAAVAQSCFDRWVLVEPLAPELRDDIEGLVCAGAINLGVPERIISKGTKDSFMRPASGTGGKVADDSRSGGCLRTMIDVLSSSPSRTRHWPTCFADDFEAKLGSPADGSRWELMQTARPILTDKWISHLYRERCCRWSTRRRGKTHFGTRSQSNGGRTLITGDSADEPSDVQHLATGTRSSVWGVSFVGHVRPNGSAAVSD